MAESLGIATPPLMSHGSVCQLVHGKSGCTDFSSHHVWLPIGAPRCIYFPHLVLPLGNFYVSLWSSITQRIFLKFTKREWERRNLRILKHFFFIYSIVLGQSNGFHDDFFTFVSFLYSHFVLPPLSSLPLVSSLSSTKYLFLLLPPVSAFYCPLIS